MKRTNSYNQIIVAFIRGMMCDSSQWVYTDHVLYWTKEEFPTVNEDDIRRIVNNEINNGDYHIHTTSYGSVETKRKLDREIS